MKQLLLITSLFLTGCTESEVYESVGLPQIALAVNSRCHSVNGMPDKACTPGVGRTTDINIICHQPPSNFRPTLAQSRVFKKQAMTDYGYEGQSWTLYQLDAVVPIEVGGDHFDMKNMYPQPIAEAHKKDKIENLAHKDICSGKKTPQEVQTIFMDDWRKYEHNF